MKSSGEVRRGDDARQDLDRPDWIGLRDPRYQSEILEVQLAHRRAPDLLEADSAPAAIGLDRDPLELEGVAFEAHIELHRLGKAHGQLARVLQVSECLDAQHVRAGKNLRYPKRPETVRVGREDATPPSVQPHGRAEDGRADLIADPTLYGSRLSPRG